MHVCPLNCNKLLIIGTHGLEAKCAYSQTLSLSRLWAQAAASALVTWPSFAYERSCVFPRSPGLRPLLFNGRSDKSILERAIKPTLKLSINVQNQRADGLLWSNLSPYCLFMDSCSNIKVYNSSIPLSLSEITFRIFHRKCLLRPD